VWFNPWCNSIRKQLTGRFFWILKLFGGLEPGVYRVEAAPDSIRITLTPSVK